MKMTTKLKYATIAAILAISGTQTAAASETLPLVTIPCAPIACAVIAPVVHEAIQAATGGDAFGPNGEGMKVLNAVGRVFGL